MIITKEIHVHAGHVVSSQVTSQGKPGKCAQMAHGHSYRIIASVNDKVQNDNSPNGGMVIDFGDLKRVMTETIYDEADHAFYIWEKDTALEAMRLFANSKDKNPQKLHVTSFVPTAENLSEYWFKKLKVALAQVNIRLSKLEVFETATSSAIYEEATPAVVMHHRDN